MSYHGRMLGEWSTIRKISPNSKHFEIKDARKNEILPIEKDLRI